MDAADALAGAGENGTLTGIMIGAAVVLVIVFAMVVFFLRRSKASRNTVLLTGPLGTGKTSLFALLTTGKLMPTQTSLQPNETALQLDGIEKPLHLKDIPGHERLRGAFLAESAPACAACVFVLDSSTILRDARPVAEYLYDVLASNHMANTPVLVLCNKKDIVTAPKKVERIVQKLESELTEIRKTRSAAVAGLDSNDTERFLGDKDSETFEFSQLPARIDFQQASLKTDSDAGKELVQDWIVRAVAAQ